VGADAGAAVRHHGDYHLGQVLRSAAGELFVIDFEGEPARPLAERRLKHSPLRDVAGMLRSFAYAAAFAARGAPPAAAGAAAARAAAWEAAARDAFVGAYFAAGGPAPYLPPSDAGAGALLALFELEKLVYEVRYELLNRPDWAGIPLGALARRLTANGGGA
jgi:maltose alpha-D-glucosyltransferase/alpha-amylase